MKLFPNQRIILSSLMILSAVLLLVVDASSSSSSSFDSAPWQSKPDSRSRRLEESVYTNLPPTVFSPTGRLHSVENAIQAASKQGNLVMAMNCKNGTVIVSTVTMSPYLNCSQQLLIWNNNDDDHENDGDSSSSSSSSTVPIFDLSPTLVAATAGNPIHRQVFKGKLHACCQSLMQQQQQLVEQDIQSGPLARFVADQFQIPTQTVGGKNGDGLLECFGLIIGNGEIWRIDPTGQFWKCHAAAVGNNANRAEEELYKRMVEQRDSNSSSNTNNDDDGGGGDGDGKSSVDCTTLTTEEGLELLLGCLESLTTSKTPRFQQQQQQQQPGLKPKTYWQAVVLENNNSKAPPKRFIRRGSFLPPSFQKPE